MWKPAIDVTKRNCTLSFNINCRFLLTKIGQKLLKKIREGKKGQWDRNQITIYLVLWSAGGGWDHVTAGTLIARGVRGGAGKTVCQSIIKSISYLINLSAIHKYYHARGKGSLSITCRSLVTYCCTRSNRHDSDFKALYTLRLGLPSTLIRHENVQLYENALQTKGIWKTQFCAQMWTETFWKRSFSKTMRQ